MSKNQRIPISRGTKRKILVESGHKCSVPMCQKSHTLEFHHINGNPSDNKKSNLIVLCPNHHAMATEGKIDRKECQAYKERLKLLDSSQPINESLKQKVEREGLDVDPEPWHVRIILSLGRKYMMWRYNKPNANLKKEIVLSLIHI